MMKVHLICLAACVAGTAYGAGVIRIGEARPGVRPIRETPVPISQPRSRTEPEPEPAREPPVQAPASPSTPVAPQAKTLLHVENAPFRRWVSSQGTSALARLIEVTDLGAVLLLADTVERMDVTREQLSAEDVTYLDDTLAMETSLKRASEAGACEYAAKLLTSAIQTYPEAPQIETAEKLLATYEAAVDRERLAQGLVRVDGQWLPKPHVEASLLMEAMADALADSQPERTVARLRAALEKHPDAANRQSVELILQRLEAALEQPTVEAAVPEPSDDSDSMDLPTAAADPVPPRIERHKEDLEAEPEPNAVVERSLVAGWVWLAWWLVPPLALLGVGRALGLPAQSSCGRGRNGFHDRRARSINGENDLTPARILKVIAIFWLVGLPLGWLIYTISA